MMIIYTLDEDYQEVYAIDNYESFIWTERFSELGDFELVTHAGADYRTALPVGTMISIPQSKRIMIVEEINEDRDDSGFSKMTYSGPSFESKLHDRVGYSKSVSSYKSRLGDLVRSTIIEGVNDAEDKIHKLYYGTHRLYPPSTIAPVWDQLPRDAYGWSNLGDVHDDAAGESPLGFRIVRDATDPDKRLYYSNYTGVNRSSRSDFIIPTSDWAFSNPFALESDQDVVVWRNLANNPKLDSMQRPFVDEEIDMPTGGDAQLSNVDCDYSVSGSALVISPSDSGTNASAAYLTGYQSSVNDIFDGQPVKGRRFHIQATLKMLKAQTGSTDTDSRRIVIRRWRNGVPTTIARSNNTPNAAGVKNTLSVRFTVPTGENDKWDVRLMNGSGKKGEDVEWSDLTIMTTPYNPIGYFDGDHSPDDDLVPMWERVVPRKGALVGRLVAGVRPSYADGVVLIQSRRWSKYQDISARMIDVRGDDLTAASKRITIDLDSPTRYLSAKAYQTERLDFVGDNFGKLILHNDSPANRTRKPNVADNEKTMISSSSSPSEVFRLHGDFNHLGGSLYFDAIIGHSTTAEPTDSYVEPLIFSEKNDDFISSRTYQSIDELKNVAYVTHGSRLVQVDERYDTQEGRRVIHVAAGHLELTGEALIKEMEVLGAKALREHNRRFMIEGVATQFNRYEYDKDYYLGDIVLVGNHRGQLYPMQVSEYIFVMDGEGFRSYPTFDDSGINVEGEWFSPPYDIYWKDAEPLGTWSDQP